MEFEEVFENWLTQLSEALGSTAQSPTNDASDADAPTAIEYGKKNPFPARILENRNLNKEGSAKETRHVEISIEGSGFAYEAGDALAVVPENCPQYVADLLAQTGFGGEETVVAPTGESLPLSQALLKRLDVSSLSIKVARAYAALADVEALAKLVEDRESFKEYAWGRQLIDLLTDYPVSFESAQQLVDLLPKLSPRLYSISSSPNAHPGEVHITVGAVRYESHGRQRKGVCSTFLAEHDGEAPVGVYFHHTKTFKLPDSNELPVIMVGPGTGIAPFRAFLEERSARKAGGKNWLFFGDQRASVDFLYQEEIESYFNDGLITRFDTAFSRDQEEKIYVQDRMREHAAELYAWLEQGACFYVCGDASRMAKDVDQALHDIIAAQSGQGADHAVDYVKALKKNKRYLRDVY